MVGGVLQVAEDGFDHAARLAADVDGFGKVFALFIIPPVGRCRVGSGIKHDEPLASSELAVMITAQDLYPRQLARRSAEIVGCR